MTWAPLKSGSTAVPLCSAARERRPDSAAVRSTPASHRSATHHAVTIHVATSSPSRERSLAPVLDAGRGAFGCPTGPPCSSCGRRWRVRPDARDASGHHDPTRRPKQVPRPRRGIAEHHREGADHVALQVVTEDGAPLPRDEWRTLAAALRLSGPDDPRDQTPRRGRAAFDPATETSVAPQMSGSCSWA
jgi:hypothetical protein